MGRVIKNIKNRKEEVRILLRTRARLLRALEENEDLVFRRQLNLVTRRILDLRDRFPEVIPLIAEKIKKNKFF
jgi:hypothetical protein